jgi:hypothetical protein
VRQWPCGAKPRIRSPLRAPAAQRGHVGLDPGLVDEHQALWIEASLQAMPAPPPSRHIGAALLNGEQRFF